MNKSTKVLVTGCNGQLGQEITQLADRYQDFEFLFTDVDNLDITDTKFLNNFVKQEDPDAIINCAAYTAVDKAEEESTIAFKINHIGVKNIVRSIEESNKNIKFIHISTDYVFDGKHYRPYTTNDKVTPIGKYAKSKQYGEDEIIKSGIQAIIIRTSWLYSSFGKNFVKTMLRLGKSKESLNVVSDQTGSPTYAADLAKAILDIVPLIDCNEPEIYHFANCGTTSWYDFAKAIFEFSDIHCKVAAIPTEEYPTPAKRPFYSVLDTSKIKEQYNIEIPYWRDSLKICVKKIISEL